MFIMFRDILLAFLQIGDISKLRNKPKKRLEKLDFIPKLRDSLKENILARNKNEEHIIAMSFMGCVKMKTIYVMTS